MTTREDEESRQGLLSGTDKRTPTSEKKALPARIIDSIKSWTVGTWIRIAILVLVIVAIVIGVAVFKVQKYLPDLLNFIGRIGIWGKIIFVVIYIVATVCFIPGSALTLGGGFLFGLYWGIFLVWLGATTGCILAFLLGRSALRSWIEKKVDQYPTFKAVDGAIAAQGWKIVLLLRLAPILPFNLLNYALALTKVSLLQYSLASAVGMLPGTALYVYIGSLAKDLSEAASGGLINPTQKIIIWVVSGVVIIVVVVFVSIIAKRAINKALAEQNQEPMHESGKVTP
jgi:uncharacterized membrane protein YdjX (TVP38/TMEM64 family)